jgi:hypothetical protein
MYYISGITDLTRQLNELGAVSEIITHLLNSFLIAAFRILINKEMPTSIYAYFPMNTIFATRHHKASSAKNFLIPVVQDFSSKNEPLQMLPK